ncbi:MAG: hypothetical protein ABI867_02475 [Kofleriaceae bacterium]
MTVDGEDLVVRACAVLREVDAAVVAGELEAAWLARPLVVGVRGDPDLVDALSGGMLARTARVGRVRLQRGTIHGLEVARGDARETLVPAATVEPPSRVELDAAIGEHRARAVAAEKAEQQLPRALRARPPWWAIWALIVRWIAGLFRRDEIATWRQLVAARDEARVVVDQEEHDHGEAAARARNRAEAFPARVRGLAADPAVTELVLDVSTGSLPAGVEVVELEGAAGPGIDVVVEVAQRAVYVRERDELRRIAAVSEIAPQLAGLATRGRAAKLAARAIEVLGSIETLHGDTLARSEAGFRSRITELDRLHVDDGDALVAAQLAAIRPQLIAQTGAIVKQVLAHVGSELDRLDRTWADGITEAKTVEELQAAVSRIDGGAAAALVAVVEETRRLLASWLGRSAFDLLPQLTAVLVERHGLPRGELRELGTPALAIPIMRKLAEAPGPNLAAVTGGRLAGLFKSFDARRSEVLTRVRQRVDEVRELASAEVLDAEPRVHGVLGVALETLLAGALERHASWLAAQLARTQTEVARDREALAPIRAARDVAHDHARKLVAAISADKGC